MKKRFLFILAMVFMIPIAVLMASCGEDNSLKGLRLEKDGNKGNVIILDYNYGESANIWDGLKLYAVYNNGDVDLSTEEYASKVKITYTDANGAEHSGNDWNFYPDAGNYQMQFEYEGFTACLTIQINPIVETNFNIYIRPQGSTAKPNISTFKFGEDGYEVAVYDKKSTLLESFEYNTIYTLTIQEKSEYDALETENEKQNFLSSKTSSLTIADSNNDVYTNNVAPGTYYMFTAINQLGNREFCYSEPKNMVTIGKGEIILTSEEISQTFAPRAEYTFGQGNTYKFNTTDAQSGNTIKALTLGELNVHINTNSGTIADPFYPEIATIYLADLGHFEFINSDIRVDYTNNNREYQAKFVLDDWYDTYFTVKNAENGTNSYFVPLNLTQGTITAPRISIPRQNNANIWEYNGETKYLVLSSEEYAATGREDPNNPGQYILDSDIYGMIYDTENADAVVVTGTKNAINVGSYVVRFALRDNVNYKWDYDFQDGENSDSENYYGNYSNGVTTYNWNINKIDLSNTVLHGANALTTTYNGQKESGTTSIYYVPGQNSFTISLDGNYIYDFMKTKIDGNFVTWAITDQDGTNATIYQDENSNDATITFSTASSLNPTITIKYSIASTSISEAYESDEWITIYHASLTNDQIEELKNDLPFEELYDDYYTATNPIRISQVFRTIPADTIPEDTTGLGTWTLNYYTGNEYIPITNGMDVSDSKFNSSYGWTFTFVPTDKFIKSIDVVVSSDNVIFYQQEISSEKIEELQTEIPFSQDANGKYVATNNLNLTRDSNNMVYIPNGTLPEATEDGYWVLTYQVNEFSWQHYGNGEGLDTNTEYNPSNWYYEYLTKTAGNIDERYETFKVYVEVTIQ